MRPIFRKGPMRAIAGLAVPVLCTGRANKGMHAGVYVVNAQTWGLEGRIYNNGPHVCRTEAVRGCATAMQLRAVAEVLSVATPGTTLDLRVTSSDATNQLLRWQGGDLTPPQWYHGAKDSFLTDLAHLVSNYPEVFTVKTANLEAAPLGPPARAIRDALLVALRQRPASVAEAAVSSDVLPLVATLP